MGYTPLRAAPTIGAVGAATAHALNNGGISVPVPAGVVALRAAVVNIYFESTTVTVTPPAGFTQFVITNTNIGYRQIVAWKRASATDSGTYDFTWTGSVWSNGVAVRADGVAPTGSFVDAASAYQIGGSAVTAPPVSYTAGADNELQLYLAASSSNSDIWTPPGGYTPHSDQASDSSFIASKPQPFAGPSGVVQALTPAASYKSALVLGLLPAAA